MFYGRSTWCFIAALAVAALPGPSLIAAPSRPNIVLILVDNLGLGDTGCYGNRQVKTPNIDRLAAEGVRLTALYSASPTCAASRAALLTGRYPQRNGLTWQLRTDLAKGLDENLGNGLAAGERILPYYLGRQGYATACFGKWNIGFAPGTRPTERGFEMFLGNASGHMDYYTYIYKGRNDMFRGTKPEPSRGVYSTWLYADSACEFIESNARRPFFLYLPFNAVHYPHPQNTAPGVPCVWQAPDEAFRAYGWSPDTTDVEQRYYATVTALDWGIGRVLDRLDALGLAGQTLVILLADNGAFKAQIGYASNSPYRTEKEMIYEGSLRVLGTVRWPGRIKPGAVCDEMLVSMDFFPMILAAAGARLPADRTIDGRDPTPTLAGEKPSPHEALYWEYEGSKAVRRGQYKWVGRSDGSPMELYDLSVDPAEANNLAATLKQEAESLDRQHRRWLTACERL